MNNGQITIELPWEELDAVLNGRHSAPFQVLGPHFTDTGESFVLRVFRPRCLSLDVLGANGSNYPLMRLANSDLFVGSLPVAAGPHYKLRIIEEHGSYEIEDAYRFPACLSDFDLHLIQEGTHYNTYQKLGAHVTTIDGVPGVSFAVWAPNAQRVSVLGDWNHWDGRIHPMRRHSTGVWELFIPQLAEGIAYKYEIRAYNGQLFEKADPYGFWAEFRPRTASVVWDIGKHAWNDAGWMAERQQRQALDAPISIYECHLGSWRRVPEQGNRYFTYRELANELVPYVKQLGYTHIELLPVTEHPFDGSWGYQTVGYYAPTSRFGTPDDFQYFVDQFHQAGIGVILDWVPAHFPKDGHGLVYFDGTHLYEHADPRQGEHPDWGTLIFNYGRNEVRNFLLSNALFWLDKYHIDGFRVDAVSSMLYLDYGRQQGGWIANQYGGRENLEAIEFLKQFNLLVHQTYPGTLTIAEESTSWPLVSRPVYMGGLGFSLKWSMGWMHDVLEYVSTDPIYRSSVHSKLTFALMYAFSENFVLSLSHDEVVHLKKSLLNKMPGDVWQKFANVRALYAFMWGHPGKKLLFMGSELGQWGEWNHDTSLDWHLLDQQTVIHPLHTGVKQLITDLNALYQREPALHTVDFEWAGFEWLQADDAAHSVLAFVRRGTEPGDEIVVVCNWTPVVRHDYWLRVPQPGTYHELLNSDAGTYGGSNVGNNGAVTTTAGADGQHYIPLTLPPLGVLLLKRGEQNAASNS
jgi:1,4-alpha-glucan branching enzyme